ncbi:GFA family protein [Photobacterium sp. WH77]|uniref:GFA family protein n=2 Tax=Photobacterium arenosum TaxID=2774143 RepID=A0ABR9BJH9_9GAMM|nr:MULTISPECIES: GFA family protein [Photobacterium]MBD8511596.1 GFA family protein [Photobacterium arenosum]MBV7264310.1 GFA family protein [Photobacterium sp. WH24]MCG2838302.1 GFA family protein [Photobacterium sp. WH77]MCG2845983.1 GFA family protein [Photobacterium sp. WH80]MDO6582640.1 GFA family protein [Photobacterium sp. 2_MG-2023]
MSQTPSSPTSSPHSLSGHCLCGKVGLKSTSGSLHAEACHCGMCRKWSGGPYLSVAAGTEVSFTGEENISRFSSSDWGERGFCKHCGSHLFYFLKPTGQYMVPAGLLDQESQLEMDQQIFIDKKPAYYAFSNNTENLTEEEVFAKYAP